MGQTNDDAASVRRWVVAGITAVGDNYEPWYVRLREAARRGESVAETLRDLIGKDPEQARMLLDNVLDLGDSQQDADLAAHYSQNLGDDGDDEDDEDDEDDGCEGHESLHGAHMGVSVFCDGSCRPDRR